jgi:nonsense-mediated mRNA decay protein 3
MQKGELEEFSVNSKISVPDIVLVRKCFPKTRKRQKERIWKLNRLPKEEVGENNIHEKKKKKGKHQQPDTGNDEFNEFLQDIEEDPEMRANINLYKDEAVIAELEKRLAGLDLDEKAKKSPLMEAMEKGGAVVGGKERKVV